MKLSDSETDIQIAGTALYDYLRDLLLLAGQEILFDKTYQAARIRFGETIVELVRAINKDSNKEERNEYF